MGDDDGHRVRRDLRELNDEAYAALAEATIRAAAERLGMTIPLVRVTAGWGDVFFVTVQVHASAEPDRSEAERVLRAATDAALEPRRHTLKLSWIR